MLFRSRELPENITGLKFSTSQTAYQLDGEIFIDEESYQGLKTQENKNTLYEHEVLMAFFSNDPTKIRRILIFMRKNPEFTSAELRTLIEDNLQIKDKLYYVDRNTYEQLHEYYSLFNREALAICDSSKSNEDKEKLLMRKRFDEISTIGAKENLCGRVTECIAESVWKRRFFLEPMGGKSTDWAIPGNAYCEGLRRVVNKN